MTDTKGRPVIDVCCGGKMFWYDKNDERSVFMDCRVLEDTLCDGRTFHVRPDILGDFRDIPFPDDSFSLAVFDPPHLQHAGENSWLAKKYGRLGKSWREPSAEGEVYVDKCKRVGTLGVEWEIVNTKLAEGEG